MDSRGKGLSSLIHGGMDIYQSRALLNDALDLMIRRKNNNITSLKLFDNHPMLLRRYWMLNDFFHSLDVGSKFWLIRQSSVVGLLAIDYVRYDEEAEIRVFNSYRIALIRDGWKIINPALGYKLGEDYLPVEDVLSEEAEQHLQFFLKRRKFKLQMMIAPKELYENKLRI